MLQAEKRDEIAQLIHQLECLNPLQSPTEHLDQVAGKWRLLYTTIRIVVRWLSTLGQLCHCEVAHGHIWHLLTCRVPRKQSLGFESLCHWGTLSSESISRSSTP